jgi:hypothetical protein
MQSGSAVESLCAPVAKMAHKTASDAPLEHTGDHKRYGHVPGVGSVSWPSEWRRQRREASRRDRDGEARVINAFRSVFRRHAAAVAPATG